MEVHIQPLDSLFHHPVCYKIPRFQREYVWNQEAQWDPLWEDIQGKAEAFLEIGKPEERFLGAIVLQQKPVPAGIMEQRNVVDGQQRLITLQILLNAMEEVFDEFDYDEASSRLSDLIKNEKKHWGNDRNKQLKIKPTLNDTNTFRDVILKTNDVEYEEEPLIVKASKFFQLQIRQFLKDQSDITERVQALEQVVNKSIKLIVIDLKESDDPHIIFETLNARGTPLLQSDLIKNMLLYEVDKAGNSQDSDQSIPKILSFQDDWWRKEIRQGRVKRPRVDVYLFYWMVMRRADEFAPEKLFTRFKRYYEEDNDIHNLIEDMNRIGNIYRAYEENPKPWLERFVYRIIRTMQVGTVNPILLKLLSSELPAKQLEDSLKVLESYLLHRMICRMNTRGYNRLFINLLKELNRIQVEDISSVIIEYLTNQQSNVGLWPSDKDLKHAFTSYPLYKHLTQGRLRIVLEGIEEELRTVKAETQSVPTGLTIEHIMPRHWRHHWKLSPDSQDHTGEERDRIIHTIGNLTLVNHRLNAALSNDPWDKKSQTLNQHTTLFINKNLLENTPDVWNEATIEERSKYLFEMAKKVWPRPT